MRTAATLLLLVCMVAAATAQSGVSRDTPPSEERLLNTPVPDIWLTTDTGTRVKLSQLAPARPLVLTFVFTRCAGVCSPFLMSWRSADRALGRQEAYARLVLSFDPRDTQADMSALSRHLALEESDNWTLAVGDPHEVRRLAEAIGFWWDWDDRRQQFDQLPFRGNGNRHNTAVSMSTSQRHSEIRMSSQAPGQRPSIRVFDFDATGQDFPVELIGDANPKISRPQRQQFLVVPRRLKLTDHPVCRLLDHAPPDPHAAHQTPVAMDLAVLLARRVAQIHVPYQNPRRGKRKAPRSALHADLSAYRLSSP